MLVSQLQTLLKSLRMTGMAESLPMRYQEAKANELDYLQFLDNLVSDEQVRKQSNLLNRRMKKARFPEMKTLEGFDFSFNPIISKKEVMALSSCSFIHEAKNVLFIGPPGVGKSHITIALGITAIHSGYTAQYWSAFGMLQEVREKDTAKERRDFIKELTSVNLLILDEFGMKKLPADSAEDILEIIHRRYNNGSTMIATNRIVSDWGNILGDNPATSAVLDRLLEDATIFNVKGGRSYRLAKSNRKEQK
jgi:DNA replication protein DnaC